MFTDYFLTSASGWASTFLVAITTTLPYVFSRRATKTRQLGPFLLRLRPHYWLGYIILGLTLFHASTAMNRQTMRSANTLGLVLAMGAFMLLFWQLVLGRSLNRPTEGRKGLRRWHLAGMLGIVVLVAGHIALNSVLLRVLIP